MKYGSLRGILVIEPLTASLRDFNVSQGGIIVQITKSRSEVKYERLRGRCETIMSNRIKISQKLLDEIADLEAQAIVDGLRDPNLSRTPAFLEKVRKFLKDNNILTASDDMSVTKVVGAIQEIPNLDKELLS